MTKSKTLTIVTTFLVSVALVTLTLFSVSLKSASTEVSTREINVNEIGTLSYEDNLNKLKENFTNYSSSINNNIATVSFNRTKESIINYASTLEEAVPDEVNYSMDIDYYDNAINLTQITNTANEQNEQSTIIEIEQDIDNEIIYAIFEDGTKVNVLDCFEEDNLNECFAISISLGIFAALGLLCVGVAIAPAPDFTPVEDFIRQVGDTVAGWWEEIKLSFGIITAYSCTTVTLTDNFIQKIAEEVKNRSSKIYLLLNPIVPNSLLSTNYYLTDLKNARNWIKKGGSVWTYYKTPVKDAIKSAGFLAGGINPKTHKYEVNYTEKHDSSLGIPTFEHYHTLDKKTHKRVLQSVHCFFGLPY